MKFYSNQQLVGILLTLYQHLAESILLMNFRLEFMCNFSGSYCRLQGLTSSSKVEHATDIYYA